MTSPHPTYPSSCAGAVPRRGGRRGDHLPDCAATAIGYQLTHEQTCPLGLAIDERCAADRRWFEAHPFATHYHRPLHRSERAELVMWGLFPDVDGEVTGRVLVSQLGPGVRARTYGDVAILVEAGVPR